jgi:hypothetical protein
VLQGFGDLTQASIDAVKRWTFLPARDAADRPVTSDAFAVCVCRPLPSSREP